MTEIRINCDINNCKKTFKNLGTLQTHQVKYHNLIIQNSNNIALFYDSVCHIPPELINTNFQVEVKFFAKKFKNHFLISLININSIRNKFHNIAPILNEQEVEILVVNETRLTKHDDDCLYQNPFYHMFRRDRGTDSGGGIIVYIKKTIKTERVCYDQDDEIISLIFCPNNKSKVALIASYRPPNKDNEDSFISKLEEKILGMEIGLEDTIIVGDLNFDMLGDKKNKLAALINTHSLSNTIYRGTRYNPTTCRYTLLDVILCYYITFLAASEVIKCSFSDHSFIISAFDFKKSYNKQDNKMVRCLSKNKLLLIKHRLKLVLSGFGFFGSNSNDQWLLIKNIINSCVDSIAPFKKMPPRKSNNSPWIDRNYVSMSKKRDRLFSRAIKKKT
jgi:hypothetical protein